MNYSFRNNYCILFLLIAIILLHQCTSEPITSSSDEQSLTEMEIVEPRLTDTLPFVEHTFLMAKYDPKKVGLFTWFYSLDNKKNWIPMTTEENRTLQYQKSMAAQKEDPYSYDIRRWWPALDNLIDTSIYIKLSAYGGEKSIIKGPIIIR